LHPFDTPCSPFWFRTIHRGGALTLDGSFVYLFPCDAEQVLRIDCQTDTLKLVGCLLLDGENKFQNGFVGEDGALYGKFQYEELLFFKTNYICIHEFHASLCCGGTVSHCQLLCVILLGIPQRATGVLRIVPARFENGREVEEDHVDILNCGEDLVATKDLFEGMFSPIWLRL